MSTQWQEIFESITASEAKQKYCIAFTARSGSTWLENLIHQTGFLGIPQEWFNPHAARNTVQASACRDLPQYYQYLKIARKNADVFAMQLTWPQAQLVFNAGHPNLFDDIQHWFYLKRLDYVAQGVSLYKAVRSGHFHSTQNDREKKVVSYDEKMIITHTLRILAHEFMYETFFDRRGIKPEALWYEELISSTTEAVLIRFIETLQLPKSAYEHVNLCAVKSRFEKVGDEKNESMTSQFKREHPEFVSYWDQHRGKCSVEAFLEEYPHYAMA